MYKSYKVIILLLFFSLLNKVSAQVVLDAGPVDLIDMVEEILYYESDEDTFDSLDIHFRFNEEEEKGYEWEVDYRGTLKTAQESDDINVKNIKLIEPSQFEKLLKGKKIRLSKYENEYIELMKFNKDHFAFILYRLDDESRIRRWKLDDIYISRYYYMKVGSKYIICLYDGYPGYHYKSPTYIVPLKNGIAFSSNRSKMKKISYSALRTITKKDKSLMIPDGNLLQKMEYKIEKMQGGYAVCNPFRENVLPQVYDSLFLSENYIVAQKNGRLTIYNSRLDTLAVKNLRAVYPSYSYIECIAGNQRLLFDNEKKIDRIPGYINMEDLITSSEYYSWNAESDTLTVSSQSVYYRFHTQEKLYDQVYFPSGLSYEYTINRSDMVIALLERWSFITEKDGKFGLASMSINKSEWVSSSENKNQKTYTFDFIEKLNPIFDKIEKYDNRQFLFYKDELIGLYPHTKEVRYRELEKKGTSIFIHYTLPSGEQGWLDTINGKEYETNTQ